MIAPPVELMQHVCFDAFVGREILELDRPQILLHIEVWNQNTSAC